MYGYNSLPSLIRLFTELSVIKFPPFQDPKECRQTKQFAQVLFISFSSIELQETASTQPVSNTEIYLLLSFATGLPADSKKQLELAHNPVCQLVVVLIYCDNFFSI